MCKNHESELPSDSVNVIYGDLKSLGFSKLVCG